MHLLPSRFSQYFIAFEVAASVVALGLAVMSRVVLREPAISIDLAGSAVRAEPAPRDLHLAITPGWAQERTFDRYARLADQLAARTGQPFRLVERKTSGELVEMLRVGHIEVALLGTGAYLHARTEGVALEVLAVPVFPSGPYSASLFVVRASGPIAGLDDLAGKVFGFTDALSVSGYDYPIGLFTDRGTPPSTFFARTITTCGHDASIAAVRDGTIDGAAVDDRVFEAELARDPTLAGEVRVIHRSPPIGVGPVVVPASLDPHLRDTFRGALLGLGDTAEGRAVLEALGFASFQPPPDGLYDEAVKIAEHARHLRAKEAP